MFLQTRRELTDERVAMRRFEREHIGAVHQLRLENLDRRLARSGPLAVRTNRWGLCGDRPRIELDDGSELRMWLFWPEDRVLAAVVRIWFDVRIGWIAPVRTAAGDIVRLYAWQAALSPKLRIGPDQALARSG